jgi:hypothetical protein
MKVINHKTGNPRHALAYNESKLEAGLAILIGGSFNIPRDVHQHPTLAGVELASVIAAHNDRPEKVVSFGKESNYPFPETARAKANDLAVAMEQFAMRKHLKPGAKTFMHLKVTFHPQDLEKLSNRSIRKICENTLLELGYANCPYLIYRHIDTSHPHAHIVLSRVDFKGNLVSDSFDGLQFKRIERELSQQYELTLSAHRLVEGGIRKMQKWESRRSLTTGEKSYKMYVQCAVMEALLGKPDLKNFAERLERRGITIAHRLTTRDGREFHGLSYKLSPELIKADFSKLELPGESLFEAEFMAYKKSLNQAGLQPPFGEIRLTLGSNNIPELVPANLSTATLKVPYSFRASQLGPAYQFESVTSRLSGINPQELQGITVKGKKGYGKNEPLTSGESIAEATLRIAAEYKLKNPILAILRDHPGLEKTVKPKLTTLERLFIESLQREDMPKSPIEQYTELYERKTLRKPTKIEIQVFQFLSKKDFQGLEAFLNERLKLGLSGPNRTLTKAIPLPPRLETLIEKLDESITKATAKEKQAFKNAIGREPSKSEIELLEALATNNVEQLMITLGNGTTLPIEYLSALKGRTWPVEGMNEALIEHIKASIPSAKLLQQALESTTGTKASEGSIKVLLALSSANEEAISQLLDEYHFFPDNLRPSLAIAELAQGYVSEKTIQEILEKGVGETTAVEKSTSIKELVATLKVDLAASWELIKAGDSQVDYRRMPLALVNDIFEKDMNLYHYLMYKTYKLPENEVVAMQVETMMRDGKEPALYQELAQSLAIHDLRISIQKQKLEFVVAARPKSIAINIPPPEGSDVSPNPPIRDK